MDTFSRWHVPFPEGATFVVGVVSEHDSELAELLLDSLMSWMLTHPEMPLLPHAIWNDCLIAPPERGSVHVEVRWLKL